jgi:hypothetical protein
MMLKLILTWAGLLVALWMLGSPALSEAVALIHACVDNAKGSLRLVAPDSVCTTKEHALTWPAEPGTGTVTYYYRDRIFTVTPGFPVGQAVFCDDPADTAVSGGYSWDGSGVGLTDAAILVSWSCRASGGTCSGSAGQDEWYLVAYLPA